VEFKVYNEGPDVESMTFNDAWNLLPFHPDNSLMYNAIEVWIIFLLNPFLHFITYRSCACVGYLRGEQL
jgi:hypothetical protein